MNKQEFEAKKEALDVKMKELGEKTKDSLDSLKIQGMYTKDKLDDMANETKGSISALKENVRMLAERAKGKASSELLKAQMNMDVAKEQLAAKKDAYDKAKMEAYIDETMDYAAACVELSMLAASEAKLAVLEALAAEQELEEKYGAEE